VTAPLGTSTLEIKHGESLAYYVIGRRPVSIKSRVGTPLMPMGRASRDEAARVVQLLWQAPFDVALKGLVACFFASKPVTRLTGNLY
jgi:hypothetical protein